ncbi:Ig domain-containing protein [Alcanivorax sp.]|uniref:Ig domain-containing protein n=1 Tax=Alcanivorax sp. TaxID=1872427 RepID=UPI0025B825DE|nr:Ig domain-containing protein [Alcanivorax sp.]
MKQNNIAFKTMVRILAGLILLMLMRGVEASHFRFGHLTWEPRPDIAENTIDISFTTAWRRSYFRGSAPDRRPQIGDIIRPGARLNFGDGTSLGSINFEVVAYSAAQDWVVAVSKSTQTGDSAIRKTYPAPVNTNGQPWIMSASGCCRIGGLRNPASSFLVRASVDLSVPNTPPSSNLPPIVTCPRGDVCTFSVPARDDGDPLRWSFSPSSESSIGALPGGSSFPIKIDSETGIVRWEIPSSAALGMYALQVKMEDIGSDGQAKSSTAIDFLIQVQDFADNAAPQFTIPPTPPANTTILAPANRPFSLDLRATDPDTSDAVSVDHVGLPSGANLTSMPGNPATGTLNWTPTEAQQGEHIITFTAIDDRGRAALPHPVKIKVIEAEIRDVTVSALLGKTDIEINSGSFQVPPDRIESDENGTRVEWDFPTFGTGEQAALDFGVLLRNPIPGEDRLVTQSIVLTYEDINGNRVRRDLEPQFAKVLASAYKQSITTDRFTYSSNQLVEIGSTVTSLSSFDSVVDAQISIHDAAGNLVNDVRYFSDIYLSDGEHKTLSPVTWNTGSAYVGEYVAHIALFDQNGLKIDEAVSPFEIVSADQAQTAASIHTDKPGYFPGETVTVQDRISNPALNAQLNEALAHTALYAPDGEKVWEQEANLPQIGPQGFHDIEYRIELDGVSPGDYTLTLEVRDQQESLLAEAHTGFEVLSTAMDGAGLQGDIQINADPVFRSEYLTINTTVSNEGNADMADVPVTLSIVDPETEQVVAQWQNSVDELPIEESDASSQSWLALAPIGATYAAVLTTHVGGNERILASRTFSIADKLPAAFALEGRGRLLALVDGAAVGSCQGVGQLDLHFQPDVVLLPRDQVLLEVYSAGGDLLDAETVSIGQASGVLNNNPGTKADVAILRSSASHVAFTLAPVNQAELSSPVRVVATHWQNGNPVLHDSGLLTPDCQSLYPGLQQESYIIDQVLAIDSAEPYDSDGAPTALSQRRFLQQLLEEAGWSYTLVSTADDFVREFETGGYTVYGLFHEAVKIPESTQHELVEAVADGAGLLYAGYHDKRNGRLESALGISARGKLPKVRGIALGDSPIHAGEDSFSLALHGKPLRVQLNGANALAHYLPSGGVSVTDYAYGQGRGVYMGFDVLAEATVAGLESTQASLITHALDHIHPQALSPVAGKVIPLSLTLTNQGLPVAGQVSLILPSGTEAVDAGTGRLADDGSLLWPFHIEAGQEQQWQFWVRLPDQPGEIRLQGKIDVGTDQGLVEYGPVGTTLDVLGQ